MMKRTSLLVLLFFGVATLFLSTAIYAGDKVSDVIKMDNSAYDKHEKSIVEFTHKKHIEEYKIGCGECHHDANGKPLTNLKAGDKVDGCIKCHKIAGRKPSGAKLSNKELLKYHAEALHQNCIDCHKKFKKETGKTTAPTSCAKCHKK
jgi:hypothetical protein